MDEIDCAQQFEEQDRERAIRAASQPLKPGQEGECERCGEWRARLVGGICAPCRDLYHLP